MPFLLSLGALEILCRFLPVNEGQYAAHVDASRPVMTFEPNRRFIWSRGWNFAIVTEKRSNNVGFLSDTDYRRDASSPLLAMIGDSYVEASQVANGDSVAGLLHTRLQGRGRVYPFAAAGAPLSTYLAYASYAGRHYRPDSMAFVVISNDYDESLLKYKSTPGLTFFQETSGQQLELIRRD